MSPDPEAPASATRAPASRTSATRSPARDLSGHAAVITGASGAIGGAVADALALSGCRLLLSGRDPRRLAAAADRARALGAAEVLTEAGDLAAESGVTALADRATDSLGAADLLVHSLGVFAAGTIAEAPLSDLDLHYRINLRAPWQLTQALLPGLIQRRGQVAFVNSTAGLHPAGGSWGAYAASKYALRALADSLRNEVNRHGVRVISVYPGRTASAMQREVKQFEGRPYDARSLLQPEEVASALLGALQLGPTAEVTDVTVRPMQAG